MAVTGGEIAILKGLKQLKRVALISIFAALATLLVCVPIYYCWGLKGVVAALVASNAVVLAIHLYFSSQVAPWRKTIVTIKSIKRGSPMVKLGLAYIFAGILGQGADYLILSFIQQDAGLDWVGLYNTGYFFAVGIGPAEIAGSGHRFALKLKLRFDMIAQLAIDAFNVFSCSTIAHLSEPSFGNCHDDCVNISNILIMANPCPSKPMY